MEWTLSTNQIPSSVEKKRAVVMYGLFGIVVMIAKKEMWQFELFHLKQASGWWLSFVFFFVVSAILFFIPVVKLLGLIPLLAMVIVWFLFVKQARDWKYVDATLKWWPLQIFSGIGSWLLGIFELEPKSNDSQDPDFFVWDGV